jgi:hypothetical protein
MVLTEVLNAFAAQGPHLRKAAATAVQHIIADAALATLWLNVRAIILWPVDHEPVHRSRSLVDQGVIAAAS